MNTTKDMRGNWKATECHPLTPGSSWHLTISTHKASSNQVVTVATVSHHDNFGCTTYRVFTDFRQRLAAITMRCTEKNIAQQHRESIALAGGLETLLAAARAHLPEYTAQEVAA